MRSEVNPAYIGTAGWAIPSPFANGFPAAGSGSHLERYSRALTGVEIGSSFYRDHLPKTYARWAASVPTDFRFSVKLSRAITHDAALDIAEREISERLAGYRALGERLGVMLIQLPPSGAFSRPLVRGFLKKLRRQYGGPAAIEPRHPTWASPEARATLLEFGVSKVLADPEPCPIDDLRVQSAGGFAYFRLHGSPVIYRSDYPDATLAEIASTLAAAALHFPMWCIFDNTTFGYSTRNAIWVQEASLRLVNKLQTSRNTHGSFNGVV